MQLHCFLLVITSAGNLLATACMWLPGLSVHTVAFEVLAASAGAGGLWNFIVLLVSLITGVGDGHRQYLLVGIATFLLGGASFVFKLLVTWPVWEDNRRIQRMMANFRLSRTEAECIDNQHIFAEEMLSDAKYDLIQRHRNDRDISAAWKEYISSLLE